MVARDKKIQSRVTLALGAMMAVILMLIALFPSFAKAEEEAAILSPSDGATLSGQVEVIARMPEASEVQLFVSKVGGALVNEGAAIRGENDLWVARWDTSIYEKGTYLLTIKSLNRVKNVLPTQTVTVTVENPISEGSEPALTTEPVEAKPEPVETKPEPVLEVSKEAVLLEGVPTTGAELSPTVSQVAEALKVARNLTIEKIQINVEGDGTGNSLTIRGQAGAETTVQLHLYSDPIVVSIQTDKRGDFVYTLDAGLSAGKHEVFITITDTSSNETLRSDIFSFIVPAAYAAPTLSTAKVAEITTATSADNSIMLYLLVSVGLIIGAIGTLLVVKMLGNTSHTKGA